MSLSSLSIVRVASPVRQQVEDMVREAILSGQLSPGDRIVERTLSGQLGVSRPLLREALRQLEAEGLVVREGNRGPVVALITIDDVKKIYAVRKALEVVAAREFAANSGKPERDRLSAIAKAMDAALKEGDADRVARLKNDFYHTITDGSENELLQQFLQQLNNRILLLRGISHSAPGRLTDIVSELDTLAAAIGRQDLDAVEEACRIHLDAALKATIAALEGKAER